MRENLRAEEPALEDMIWNRLTEESKYELKLEWEEAKYRTPLGKSILGREIMMCECPASRQSLAWLLSGYGYEQLGPNPTGEALRKHMKLNIVLLEDKGNRCWQIINPIAWGQSPLHELLAGLYVAMGSQARLYVT